MNSAETIINMPYTIQNYDNFLKDYINISGFNWDSKCLDIIFKNIGGNFDKYIQKVGEYNTVYAANPKFISSKSYKEKDYSNKCPEGWTESTNKTCKNLNYTGPCQAGRITKDKIIPTCPAKIFGDLPNAQNNNYYTGWYGPYDASLGNFNNTNIVRNNEDEGTYCTAGKAADNSENGAKLDCENSGGQWINYYDDPGFFKNSYTCYKPTRYNNVTEESPSFEAMNDNDKLNWENKCKAYWPIKTVTTTEKWSCTYGDKIESDIANGKIFRIGDSNSPIEAAKIALQSNRLKNNYFFMIDDGIYITNVDIDIGIITSKGNYEPKCTEKYNKKAILYFIKQDFFKMLDNCKMVNDKINSVNSNWDILKNALIKENFTNDVDIDGNIVEHLESGTTEIINRQNEIINNLASNYNLKAELYNRQVNLLGNSEKIIETHNKKLNKQLDDLVIIQDKIALKNRVIELNEEIADKQILYKKIIIVFFTLIPFIIITLVLLFTKSVNSYIGYGILLLILVGYIIYIIVMINLKGIKNFGKESKRVISKYEKAITNYWENENKKLQQSLGNFIEEKCQDEDIDSEETSRIYQKGDYIMQSNNPFYYYDGSAPPQQIHPGPIGSIKFSIENEIQKFPNINFTKIKNPITKFFFETWLLILNKNGINVNDPRFTQDLDIIDYPDSDQNPSPYWDSIKLPIISNIDKQYDYLFQNYSGNKKNISKSGSKFIVDYWNFIFGDRIPGEIYKDWINKLATFTEKTNPNIEQFYNDYINFIKQSNQFSDKFGGWEKFIEVKMKEFLGNINVSSPVVKKYTK
jgi:hypothetical protein